MSDLFGGGAGYSGNGRPSTNNNGGRTAVPAPAPTGSPASIRGPRAIMQERAAREARQKAAEQEAIQMERQRAIEEQQALDEERRRDSERRKAAAGTATGGRGSGGEGYAPQRISDNSQKSAMSNEGANKAQGPAIQGRGTGGRALGGGEPRRTARATSGPTPAQTQAGPSTAQPQAPSAGDNNGGSRRATQSSFPHAFERWETLSSHWEGLTSYWIRRLEENSREIDKDPISSQLSRQVTDLSAAGANLFHAVVELQRLRASSERKFQRWFFETRAEQERAQEVNAMLEQSLQEERASRSEAINKAVEEAAARNHDKILLEEMKRELQISKEEARRAWEELGRREQEERERTASLREGQPTLVGGVQVVPMMSGAPSRHGSAAQRPTTREGLYAGTSATSGPLDDPEVAYQQHVRAQRADPFAETQTSRPSEPSTHSTRQPTTGASTNPYTPPQTYSSAPAVQPTSSAGFYQQAQGTTLHPTDIASDPGTLSEGEYEIDAQGHFRLDAEGNKIRYRDPVSDDDEAYPSRSHYGLPPAGLNYPPVEASRPPAGYSAPYAPPAPTSGADYTGAGYGSQSGAEWGAVPRHHHPTRLSDVLEEDERSRTSASMVSRRE
jgi:hypothetical protein